MTLFTARRLFWTTILSLLIGAADQAEGCTVACNTPSILEAADGTNDGNADNDVFYCSAYRR